MYIVIDETTKKFNQQMLENCKRKIQQQQLQLLLKRYNSTRTQDFNPSTESKILLNKGY